MDIFTEDSLFTRWSIAIIHKELSLFSRNCPYFQKTILILKENQTY